MSKSFGALKSAVLRILRRGYAPQLTQMTVTVDDRERLRRYCVEKNIGSMVEGFSHLLTEAGIPRTEAKSEKIGRMTGLVEELRRTSFGSDSEELAERVRKGEFDEVIRNYGF